MRKAVSTSSSEDHWQKQKKCKSKLQKKNRKMKQIDSSSNEGTSSKDNGKKHRKKKQDRSSSSDDNKRKRKWRRSSSLDKSSQEYSSSQSSSSFNKSSSQKKKFAPFYWKKEAKEFDKLDIKMCNAGYTKADRQTRFSKLHSKVKGLISDEKEARVQQGKGDHCSWAEMFECWQAYAERNPQWKNHVPSAFSKLSSWVHEPKQNLEGES